MVFGYARVSTNEQNLDLQIDAFLNEGIYNKNIYTDKVSSTKEDRKSLNRLFNYVREGDTIVWVIVIGIILSIMAALLPTI